MVNPTQQGAEADLVLINPAGKVFCIEIKFSSAPNLSRGFYQSIEDLAPDRSFAIVPTGDPYPKGKGVRVISLPDFLANELFG